jgi:hypothetical protein
MHVPEATRIEPQASVASYVFRITADATPDVLSRVVTQFNAANRPLDGASLSFVSS